MKTNLRPTLICLVVILILLLAACNMKTIQQVTEPATSVPTEEPITLTEAPIAATEAPVVLNEPEAGTTMLWTDSSYVVYVPAGEFIMGKDEIEPSDHGPAHTVTLGGYWIHQSEVTNAMYALCVDLGICSAPTHDPETPNWYADPEFANAPVVGVDWNQAETYCEWIEARLPTEAEWEKAGRGTDGATYPWGEDQPACNLLNFEDCLLIPAPEIIRTYPLGASPYNLADMAGNVFEWVYDRHSSDYYASSPSSNPTGPDSGEKRVVRGSSYLSPADEAGIFLRNSLKPDQERADLGFRCVLTGEAITSETPSTPVCTTLGFDLTNIGHQWPVYGPTAPPGVSLQTYCNVDNQNNQYGTAAIKLDPGINPLFITFSSPQGSLICHPDPNDPLKFNCSGTALKPGKQVTISICNVPPAPILADPVCPVAFYHFDPATNLCEYGIPHLIVCADPNVAIFGYGCLPAPQNGECPVGSYDATYNNKPVCIPAGGPKCQGQLCPAACPAGLVFNEGNFCCDYPPDVKPVCPPGYSYNEPHKMCTPDTPIQAGCTNITTLVESCPPPVVCSSFFSESSCIANPTCQWNPYVVRAGGYCSSK